MQLTNVYVRFFRSFNFDYERKAKPGANRKDWELIDGAWFPFVTVGLDPRVTAIVGANESGKSHLISAIKVALGGQPPDRRDFCRYSTLFSVETGSIRTPDFGIELALNPDSDAAVIEALSPHTTKTNRISLLRLHGFPAMVLDAAGTVLDLDANALQTVENGLPVPFELKTGVAIPDNISLDVLLDRTPGLLASRKRRFALIEALRGYTPAEDIADRAEAISDALGTAGDDSGSAGAEVTPERLARSLLLDVAQIDRSAFEDLEQAIRDGDEGRADGLIEQMNRSLATRLNFARWWRQDKDFALRLSPRERELVFTIRDRTGTDYSFRERSRGLTYFLSYYVQLLAHRRDEGRSEVLLMDEPDAYLSSTGQQDLLRTLENFARPDDGRRDQVVYVTHSPFLINKNAADRIRVLDKGSDEEGTRVVDDVARNHYEPLRTSIGAHVAETAFIGGANLLVEGVADQVLLTGLVTHLQWRSGPSRNLIDLNDVTIVPSGSASSVPYMAYLARGRDETKPSCVALLDSDDQGEQARKKLSRGEADGKQILASRYVLMLGEWAENEAASRFDAGQVVEIEDLIPAAVAAEAANRYAIRLLGIPADEARLTAGSVTSGLVDGRGRVWLAVEAAFESAFDTHIDKVGFAKEIVNYLETIRSETRRPTGVKALEENFASLIAHIAHALRRASADEANRRQGKRVRRVVKAFLLDHPSGATRDAAELALEDIEASLDDSVGDQAIAREIGALRRSFGLGADPGERIPDYDEFIERMNDLHLVGRRAYQEAGV